MVCERERFLLRPDKRWWVWPCFNCKTEVQIDGRTWGKLDAGLLKGIKCPKCLEGEPTEARLLRLKSNNRRMAA